MNRPTWIWVTTILCVLAAIFLLIGGIRQAQIFANPQSYVASLEAAQAQIAEMQSRYGMQPGASATLDPALDLARKMASSPAQRLWTGLNAIVSVALAALLFFGVFRLMTFRFSGVTALRFALTAQIVWGVVNTLYTFGTSMPAVPSGPMRSVMLVSMIVGCLFALALPAIPLLIMWRADKSVLA